MKKVPIYLRFYLLCISKGSDKPEYFIERFVDMPKVKMMDEAYMVKELYKYGLIALPEKTVEKVYDPADVELPNGAVIHRASREVRIPYYTEFFLLPAGRYLFYEAAFTAILTFIGTIVVATIGWLTAYALSAITSG